MSFFLFCFVNCNFVCYIDVDFYVVAVIISLIVSFIENIFLGGVFSLLSLLRLQILMFHFFQFLHQLMVLALRCLSSLQASEFDFSFLNLRRKIDILVKE